ncbi:hypothetical protein [Devosia chinhatensis]|uniref:Uncharacterized protein n=1 Tax=Devosia chinhatensis TaxID=429727 RepID=A0A0F5FKT5_9HYPH|nr:hypothetical protein [Devosia chinhatensis]KKB09413.1 hypothetical protein VE26_05620 [Devosia chinhatensis]
MATVFMNDPATGRFALFDEAPGGGAVDNPNSLRNRPLNDPLNWLANIYFHSDFNYLEVAFGPTNVTVNHSAVSVVSPPIGATVQFGWNGGASVDRLLFTHSLGYVPLVMAVLGNNMVWPGMPVQSQGDGGVRFATIYATSTEVRMKEFGTTGPSTLAAASLTYTLLIFANQPSPTGNVLFDFDPVTGIVEMGRRKFKSDRRYLQVVPGGSPFGISYGGRTIDLANGAPRAVRADGTAFDPIPASLGAALSRLGYTGTDWGFIYGSGMNYTGSFTGPGQIQVQAP